MLFKPAFHQRTVAVALKSQRRQHLATAPRSGHRDAASAMSQAFTLTAASLTAPAVSPTQGVFDAGFIHINPIFRGDAAQLLQKLFAARVIALDVEETLFLRV